MISKVSKSIIKRQQQQIFNQVSLNKFSSLVIGESKDGKLNKSFFKIINAANQLKQDTHLLISGENVQEALNHIKQSVSNQYVQKIIVAEHADLKYGSSDSLQQIVKQLVEKNSYTQVISDASTVGKDVLPRIAASFNSQAVTDITQVIDESTYQRPVYAGNAISTVKSSDKIKFLSFRPTAFEEISQDAVSEIQDVETMENLSLNPPLTKVIKEEIVKSDRPELGSAKVVVSGGRGLKNGENFKILEELGDAIGNAAIGASRAAVDAGYVSNDLQVGQTGKVVAPELYVAVGISGAIQHLAGMKDSKVIVAINKDSEAPIFDIATYGLVGDLFKIVPELTEKLNAQK